MSRHDVGDDACVGGAGRIEEELDDRVADHDLRVVVGRHQDQQAGDGEQGAGDHDRPAASESSIQAVRPGTHEGRHRHREHTAQAEGNADGRVLQPLGDHLVDLGLDQDGREGQPEEVAPEPEGA